MLGTNSVISGQGNKEGGENKPTKPQTFSFGRVCFNICFCFTETTGICKMFTREARIRWKRDESHPRLDNMLVLSRTGEGQIGRLYLFDLVSYYQHTTAQKSKTGLCISLGVHMLWLACFQATCERSPCGSSALPWRWWVPTYSVLCPALGTHRNGVWSRAQSIRSLFQARYSAVLKFKVSPSKKKCYQLVLFVLMHILYLH